MKKLLISVMGRDQPGILAAVSTVIYQRQGNIENLSQTLLQSVFGALLIITVPDTEAPDDLHKALLEACSKLQLTVHVNPAFPESSAPGALIQPYIVSVMGPDRQGLVSTISSRLAQHDVNITNMQAVFKGGDKALDNLMIFEVDVPKHTVMQKLREDLKAISDSLSLDISVQHRKIFESVSKIRN
ncbi:MAG: ACT domain-containing protein [Pseudomonadales bacterium]|nr:ACT domain-containing protein [Pseudomonadales bacterium]